jgi:hypothetical protein
VTGAERNSATAGSPGGGRGPRLTPVRLAMALSILAILVAATVILLQRAPRLAGTNLTADAGFVIQLRAGQELCEPGELLPGDTGALRLDATANGFSGPPLSVSISATDGPISAGTLAAGWRPGAILIGVRRVPDGVAGATVCVRDSGSRAVSFGGSVPDSGFQIELAGEPLGGRLRIEYMRPGRESWLQLLPALAYRFSLAKSGLMRHWEAGALLVLMLVAVGLAARAMIEAEPSR